MVRFTWRLQPLAASAERSEDARYSLGRDKEFAEEN